MSSFFDQELWRLFGDGKIIGSPACSGRTCFGTLGKDLRVRIQFVSTHISGEYDALKLTVLNHTDGPVNTQVLKLKDLLGKKIIPTDADYETIRQAVGQYLNVFRDRQRERTQNGPKLVYICAPLRGNVEKNIEFARQKAQEVFQAGDIPVCPHLMFPPIADPKNPVQDQTARDMGLRLVESCQEVRVYGPEWTEGMQAEIRHAMNLGIQVRTDQGSMLPDCVPNWLSGFAQEQVLQKPKMELPEQDGSISGECVETGLSPPADFPKSTKKKVRNAHER